MTPHRPDKSAVSSLRADLSADKKFNRPGLSAEKTFHRPAASHRGEDVDVATPPPQSSYLQATSLIEISPPAEATTTPAPLTTTIATTTTAPTQTPTSRPLSSPDPTSTATPPSASPARSNRPPRGRRPRFISRRRTASSESTSFASGSAAIASTTGSHELAPRSPTPTFVNMAAVIGEDVAIDCPLRDAIAWLKGKKRLRAGVRDGLGPYF